MGDGNVSTGRSGLYLHLYLHHHFVGGLESLSYDENSGVTFRRQIGNSWNEPEPNPYDITGTFTRFQIRGKTLHQLAATVYPTMKWIDWRQLPFNINIHQNYVSADGTVTYEDTWEHLRDVFVTRVSISQPNETGNRMETVQFVARGLTQDGKGIATLGPDGTIFGGLLAGLPRNTGTDF
jgi:hypothetical protein